MEDQYDIHSILKQYHLEADERKQERAEEDVVQTIWQTDETVPKEDLIYEDMNVIREMGAFQTRLEKIASRVKKKRWGGWHDLILESDRQEAESIL